MKMRFYLLFTVSAFTAMAAAQPRCDPQTQYEKNGECCNMCEEGKRMLEQSTCQDPVCKDCGENEYMETYTSLNKCFRQPYCDPNKNFQVPIHKRNKKTICLCKEGFYCSSIECITCVQHTECELGFGVQTKGDQEHDTVCERCPSGTFSNEISSDAVCLKWTVCEPGYEVEKNGTEMSDTTCVKQSRAHTTVIIVVLCIVVGGLVLAGFGFYINKKKSRYYEMREKVYACMGCQETGKIVQDEQNFVERSTPVENEDEESMLDHGVTENGNVLTQEHGKMEVLPRQESQTQESCSV